MRGQKYRSPQLSFFTTFLKKVSKSSRAFPNSLEMTQHPPPLTEKKVGEQTGCLLRSWQLPFGRHRPNPKGAGREGSLRGPGGARSFSLLTPTPPQPAGGTRGPDPAQPEKHGRGTAVPRGGGLPPPFCKEKYWALGGGGWRVPHLIR